MAKIICTTAPDFKRLGGAGAVRADEGILELIPELALHGVAAGEDVIVFHESLRDILSPEQLAAILAHEESHIELGHTALDYAMYGLEAKQQFEIAADRRAVSLGHRASVLMAAVGILTEVCIRDIFSQEELGSDEAAEAMEQCRKVIAPINQERAAALGL